MSYIMSYYLRDDFNREHEKEFDSTEEVVKFYDKNSDMIEALSVTDETGEEVDIFTE
jgi:hypothetical protein